MSRTNQLIAELRPEGVPFLPIGEWATLVRGNGMPRSDFVPEGVGCIHYGQIYTHYGTWANRTLSFVPPEKAVRLAKVDPGDVIVTNTSENLDDVCKAVAWLGPGQIVTGGHATVVKHGQDPKFIAYYLQTPSFHAEKRKRATGTKVIDVSANSLAGIPIPLPPIEVQREIVRILDTFSELEAELEAELKAELEARRKQYAHYRKELLTRAASDSHNLLLSEIGRIVTGRTPKSGGRSAWGDHLDFVTPTDIHTGMREVGHVSRRLSKEGAERLSASIIPTGSILVTCIGADMGKTVINSHDCITNQQINSVILGPDTDAGYLFHALTAMRPQLREQASRSSATLPIINKGDFGKIRMAIPSLREQRRVAATLDTLDALVNDLSVGLPAELAARRKQYEYYRDKLLTFEEAR